MPSPPDIEIFMGDKHDRLTDRESSPRKSLGLAAPAPILYDSFQAQKDLPADDLSFRIPPDVGGAAGPNHLMSVHNSRFRVQTKAGDNASTSGVGDGDGVGIETFWSAVNGSDAFDPHVMFDVDSGRWIAVSDTDRRSANSSVLVAVSATDDPTGDWFLHRIDADSADTLWADYPGLGANPKWIVITNNMFPITVGVGTAITRSWVLEKASLLGGETPAVHQIDIAEGFNVIPAVSFDDAEDVHAVDTSFTISGGRRAYRVSRFFGDTQSPAWESLGLFAAPTQYQRQDTQTSGDAPQSGDARLIETNDNRIMTTVFRNGSLWFCHNGGLPAQSAITRVAVFWGEFDPATESFVQSGVIDGGDGVYYIYPSLAVNIDGDVGVGFTRCSADTFASAHYTGREHGDPAGTMRDPAQFKAGEAAYFKDFGTGENRWGDFSATTVDPAESLVFWTIQEYAAAPIGGTSKWGSWWASFGFVEPTPTPTATPTESPTPTATESATPTPTASVSPTATATSTEPPTPSPTESATPTSTETPTPTASVTASPTPSETPTISPTATPTATPFINPLLDQDRDGYSDVYELSQGTSPLDAFERPALGDMNGDGMATLIDAVLLYKVVTGRVSGQGLPCWDVNQDGRCDIDDALILYRWAIGMSGFSVIPLPAPAP